MTQVIEMNANVGCSGPRELRKGTRYSLKKTALFSWALQNEEPQSGEGVTRDFNNSGVYVLTDELPQIGALVQLDIVIPELPGFYLGMHLLGDGIVTRVEQHGTTQDGFAASVYYYIQRAKSPCESSAAILRVEDCADFIKVTSMPQANPFPPSTCVPERTEEIPAHGDSPDPTSTTTIAH